MKNFKTLFNAIQDFSTWFNSNPFGIIKQVWKDDYEYYFEEYYNYLNQFCVYQFKKDQQLLLEEFLKENKNYSFDVLQNAMDIFCWINKNVKKAELCEWLNLDIEEVEEFKIPINWGRPNYGKFLKELNDDQLKIIYEKYKMFLVLTKSFENSFN